MRPWSFDKESKEKQFRGKDASSAKRARARERDKRGKAKVRGGRRK